MAILNNILKGQLIWSNHHWDIQDQNCCIFWDTLYFSPISSFLSISYSIGPHAEILICVELKSYEKLFVFYELFSKITTSWKRWLIEKCKDEPMYVRLLWMELLSQLYELEKGVSVEIGSEVFTVKAGWI